MYCPRLDHFVRFNHNGTVSRCGHMIDAPQFDTLDDMESSEWLAEVKSANTATECARCIQTETVNGTSIRLNAIEFDKQQTRHDYLIVGGVLDNICNSACLTCNQNLSTKIGSLKSKTYPIVDNSNAFWKLPLARVVHLDINGGEPSASKNYRHLLQNIPSGVNSVRINTNCGIVISEIEELQKRGIHVTVTVSLDGIGEVHDLVRWPIKWDRFVNNLLIYKNMGIQELNTWTTVSALNIGDLPNIFNFVSQHDILHSWAFLVAPDPLNVKYSNAMTSPFKHIIPGQVAIDRNNQTEIDDYMFEQYKLRGIQ
jgi:sulfatase maturation enzyme AslB (radical SAM superfamily)